MLKVEKNLSKETIIAYDCDISKYLDFFKKKNINLLNIKQSNISQYIYSLYDEKYSSATIARMFSSIRSFHKFLFSENLLEEDPTLTILNPKVTKKLPDILEEPEISAIINAGS